MKCLCSLFLLVLFGSVVSPPQARAQAYVVGEWRTLSSTLPLNPIHVALMRTGRVAILSGSENEPTAATRRAAVWDPVSGALSVQTVDWDFFCNGMAFLPDGRLLVTGGNLRYDPVAGIRTVTIFDPATERFLQAQDMARGRWYPTTTALPDGRVSAFSGLTEDYTRYVVNDSVELYSVSAGWSPEIPAGWEPPLYPWLHVVPDGRLFYSGPQPDSKYFDPVTGTWTFGVAYSNASSGRRGGASVLLPLTPESGYRPRVLIMGGSPFSGPAELVLGSNPATATAEIIDLSAPRPIWLFVPPMSGARVDMTAVILPTGKVLALGGSTIENRPYTATRAADLFDPVSETWAPAGVGAYPRLYHSVALLLPDATVWVAGSNPYQGSYEARAEIYAPAYLFTVDAAGQTVPAPRPAIASAPARVGYGASFGVATPQAADIASVVLVRPGASTHGFDMEQRLVGLAFTPGIGTLTVTAPPDGAVAPPGYYMLFLVDRRGVPSVASFVQLSATPANQAPRGTIVSPADAVTIQAGQSVTFDGDGADPDGSIAGYSWVFPTGAPAASTVRTPGPVVFPTPGTYIVSLTVTDNAGETDPSPPTRTVTVVP